MRTGTAWGKSKYDDLVKVKEQKCTKCGKVKSYKEFTPSPAHPSTGLSSHCRQCTAERSKDYRDRKKAGSPQRGFLKEEGPNGRWSDPNYQHREKMFKKYGIRVEDYNRMFAQQKGCCAICGRHQSVFKKKLNIDHNHTTGKVRGLLCINCNHGIGQFKDSQELLLKAHKYLEIDNN